MPRDGGFKNSTGVDYSPPSPANNSSGPSRPLTPVAPENSNPAYTLKPANSVKGAYSDVAKSQAKIFDQLPPTAPRLMRQNISPPPLRRADSHRDAGSRNSERVESSRPCQSRYGSDLETSERARVDDSYRPLPPHRLDVSWADYGIIVPSTDARSLRYLDDTLKSCNFSWRDNVNQPRVNTSLIKVGEGGTGQDTMTFRNKHGSRENKSSNHDHKEEEHLESRAQEGIQKGSGLPHPKTRFNKPSRHDTYPSHLSPPRDCRPYAHTAVRDDVAAREHDLHLRPIEPPECQSFLEQQVDGMGLYSTSRVAHLHNSNLTPKSPLSIPLDARLSTDLATKPPLFAQMVMEGEKYKHITCPSWQHSGCRLIEAHCIFAHKITGRAAPRGDEKEAKDFTCPRWQEDSCTLQAGKCKYAHKDTGLYVGIDGKASLKHITCWYWKFKGRCRLSGPRCLYAHAETGVLAWQPIKDSSGYPGSNSLKGFMCPRFEAGGRCQFQCSGTCPYTHNWSAKSCHEHYNRDQVIHSRKCDSAGQSLPSGVTPTDTECPPRNCKESGHPTASPPISGQEALQSPLRTKDKASTPPIQPQPSLPVITALPPPDALEQELARRARNARKTDPARHPLTQSELEGAFLLCSLGQSTSTTSTAYAASEHITESRPARTRSGGAARRGGLLCRPLLGRNKTEATSVKDAVQHVNPVPDAVMKFTADTETQILDRCISKSPTSAAPSITLKRCGSCNRPLYSTGGHCKRCLAKMDELRPRKDKAPDEGDRDVSCIKTRPQDTTPDYTSGSPLPGPSLGDVQTIDQASVTPDVSGQERAGDNPRKRSVKEDVMFVLNKRQKGSHNVREAAIANLRQGCRKPAGNHPAGMPDTESPKECRYLSKNSTISGPQEKAASERIFTVEATTPSPVQQDGLTEAERDLFPRNAATSKTETAGKAKFSERVDGKHGLAPGTELRTRSPTGGMWQSGSVVSNQIDEEDDSTDSMECESFAHDSVSQAPDLITPNEQRATSEATDEIIGEKHAIEGADHVSVMRLHDIENTASESPDSEDEFIPADSSYNKHEEDDEQPDQTTHHRPPNSGRGSRNSRSAESTTAAASNTSASDAQSPSTFDTRGRLSPSASPLTTPPDSRSVSRPRIEGRKTADLKEDEAGAIEKLKAMGVMFESDSEDEDQEMEGDDFQPLPPSRVDPLWQRPDRSRNLFEIDPSLDMTDPANRLTAVGILPSSTRPSKKKLMGNLLVYQCAEHKKRFGNPHQEVRRYPEEAPVTTVVQLGIDFDTPGDPQVKMEKATMTFREFLGAPTYPVIEARKDQLVFREKEPVQQLAGRNGRTRRKMEMDIFPFVDGGTQVNQLNGVRLLGARRRHRTAGHQD